MQTIDIDIKRLTDTAVVPSQATVKSGGFDLYADIKEPIIIDPHETDKIKTGLAMAIPEGFAGGIYARSGMAVKKDLAPANCVGIIDSDYRGEIIVALHNNSNTISRQVNPGDRIAQFMLLPCYNINFHEKEELDDTVRGDGGFGSTGEK